MKKLGVLLSHPVQYYSPFFKELAKAVDLTVYYCYQPNSKEQGVGFGVAFQWDIPLLEGYNYEFINNAKEVKKRIKDGNFDLFIVIAWNYIAAHQALEACKSFNIPIYARGDSQLSTRPLWFRCLKRIYFSKFLSKFDGFLSPSQRFEEYLLFYGVSKDKIIFCPHFVDNNFFRETKFSSLKEKINTKKNYGFYENEILLLFCGKFIDKKRPLDFLHALKVLKEKKVNVGGLLVGDGILRKKMQDYSIKHKLNAVFLGFLNQRELPGIYSISDCLVLPSSSEETWGLVVNEAFACGVPAIVSDKVGCCPDLIDEGMTGYVYRCSNIAELTLKITDLIAAKNKSFNFSTFLNQKMEKYCIKTAIASINSIFELHL